MKKNFFLYLIQKDAQTNTHSTAKYKKMGNDTSKHIHSLKEALQIKPVSALFPEGYKLISADAHETVGSVFNKLAENNILSVPIYDPKSKKFYAFLDLIDIVTNTLELQQEYPLREKAGIEDEEFGNEPCLDLVNKSQRNFYHTIEDTATLQKAVNELCTTKAHRLAVLNKDNELVSILTQSKIIQYLAKLVDDLQLGNKKIKDLCLGKTPVISINLNKSRALDAFKTIQMNNISGLAIVDDDGAIVDNLSVSDLKLLEYNKKVFDALLEPLEKFLKRKSDDATITKPVVITQDSTLRDVLNILTKTRVHRLYVVDNHKRPSGIVTLTDLMETFADPKDN
jgi:CBS domain-containing protein